MNTYKQHQYSPTNQFTIKKTPEIPSSKPISPSESVSLSGEFKQVGSEIAHTLSSEVSATLPNMLRQILGQPALHIDRDPQLKQHDQELWKKRYQMKEMQRQQEVQSLVSKQHEQDRRTEEVRKQLQVIAAEVGSVAKQVEIQAFDAPAKGSIYHEHFFRALIKILKNIGKQINRSAQWLSEGKNRSAKIKNQGVLSVAKQGSTIKTNVYQSQERSLAFQG